MTDKAMSDVEALAKLDDAIALLHTLFPEKKGTLRQLRNHIAARLAQQPKEMGQMNWQPIETAPRDGSMVFLYQPEPGGEYQEGQDEVEGYMFTGWYNPPVGAVSCGEWQCAEYSAFPKEPTHWMPLPGRPAYKTESIARRLCEIRGIDPDERVSHGHPSGYGVTLYSPRWQLVEQEVIAHLQMTQAVEDRER